MSKQCSRVLIDVTRPTIGSMIHQTICEYRTEGMKIERGELTSVSSAINQNEIRTILRGPDASHKVVILFMRFKSLQLSHEEASISGTSQFQTYTSWRVRLELT